MSRSEEMTRDRILVTCGAVFIGSELVRQLADAGHRVVVVDNLVNGHQASLWSLVDDDVVLATADVRDTERTVPLLSGVSLVYHLACLGVRQR